MFFQGTNTPTEATRVGSKPCALVAQGSCLGSRMGELVALALRVPRCLRLLKGRQKEKPREHPGIPGIPS